jgi:hypothetical protein
MRRVALALFLILVAAPAAAPAQGDGRALYADLRARALHTTLRDLPIRVSLAEDAREPVVYGIVMDMDINGETATLVAFITGDASIYLSTGGGWIGGIEDPRVAEAAHAFLRAADSVDFNGRTAATAFPRPGPGRVHFYLLTSGGVLPLTATTEALQTGTHALSPLYAAGQGVITRVREADEGRGSGR